MTYEYECKHCDYKWEEEQPITAEPVKICPKCNKETAYRLISSGTKFILKGSGWAASGYSSK